MADDTQSNPEPVHQKFDRGYYTRRPHVCLSSPDQDFQEYTVKSGDTMGSIADEAGCTWQELADFNWGTHKPPEINSYLGRFLDCPIKHGKNRHFIGDERIYLPPSRLRTDFDESGGGSSESSGSSPALRSPIELALRRVAHKQHASNTSNRREQIYLNVGSWGDNEGRSDFALVSGQNIALCSWLGEADSLRKRVKVRPTNGRIKEGHDAFLETFSERYRTQSQVRRFVDAAGTGYQPRVHASYAPVSSSSLSADSTLFAFLPDMHIHLFRGLKCDNFTDSKGASLAKPLADFIKHAKKNGTKIFHVGDLFEIWEAQAIFKHVVDAAIVTTSTLDAEPDWPWNSNYRVEWERNEEAFKKVRKAMNIEVSASEFGQRERIALKWSDKISPFLASECFNILHDNKAKTEYATAPTHPSENAFSHVHPYYEPLDLNDHEAVVNAIKGMYPEMKVHLWQALNNIDGNHDIMARNPYLESQSGLPGARSMPESQKGWVDRDDQVNRTNGKKEGIENGGAYGKKIEGTDTWYEHGHAFDPFNNLKTYYRESGRSGDSDNLPESVQEFMDGLPTDVELVEHESVAMALSWLYQPPIKLNGGYHATAGWAWDEITETSFGMAAVYKLKGRAANHGLEWFAYDRVQAIFQEHKDVKLVIMGHTHVPMLEDYSVWSLGSGRVQLAHEITSMVDCFEYGSAGSCSEEEARKNKYRVILNRLSDLAYSLFFPS